MNIEIKYNEEIDEFTEDLTLEMRLKRYVHENFYPAYAISMLAPTYLIGGAIRDLIEAKKPKDLDFVVLGKRNLDWILRVLQKYHIDYTFNRFGGFKINYKGTDIDLWATEDLFSALEYNVDGLLFDVNNNSLLSLTFEDFCINGLKKINEENNIEKGREKKLRLFEKSFRNRQTVNR